MPTAKNKAPTKSIRTDSRNVRLCVSCGSRKPISDFYSTTSVPNMQFFMCRRCGKRLLKDYTDKVEKPMAALWLVLAQMGVPFILEAWYAASEMYENDKTGDLITFYLISLANLNRVYEGFWQSDAMLSDMIKTGVGGEVKDIDRHLADANKFRARWGDYTADDWDWLEREYLDYTRDLDSVSVSAEKAYRSLCKCNLRFKKESEAGEETKSTTDEILKWMKLLRIDDFRDNTKSDEDRYIDHMAWKFENTEPAELTDEERYKDVKGYEKIYNDWMRSMQNMIAGTKKYPNIPKEQL